MGSREAVIERFERECLHDDTVLSVRIVPARSHRGHAAVEVDLAESGTGRLRRLTFSRVANVRLGADLDVLRDNLPWNLNRLSASADDEAICELIASQADLLNIEYLDCDEEPIEQADRRAKLDDPSSWVLFRIALFGGTLELVATGFKLTRPRARVGT